MGPAQLLWKETDIYSWAGCPGCPAAPHWYFGLRTELRESTLDYLGTICIDVSVELRLWAIPGPNLLRHPL